MKMKLLGIFLLLGFIPFSTVCAHASPVKYYHYRIQAENKTHQQTTPYLEMSQKTNLMSNVSPDATVKQGTSQTPAAYGFANQQHVMLTAENNRYNENVYLVSGHWQAATK